MVLVADLADSGMVQQHLCLFVGLRTQAESSAIDTCLKSLLLYPETHNTQESTGNLQNLVLILLKSSLN